MASIQKGAGVKWSFATTVTVVAAGASSNQSQAGIGAGVVQSVKYGTKSNKNITYKLDGERGNETYSDQEEVVTITVLPSAATIALAKAAHICPSPGSDVAIVDSEDAQLAGTYICDEAEKTSEVNGVAMVSITMHASTGNTLATVAAS